MVALGPIQDGNCSTEFMAPTETAPVTAGLGHTGLFGGGQPKLGEETTD